MLELRGELGYIQKIQKYDKLKLKNQLIFLKSLHHQPGK